MKKYFILAACALVASVACTKSEKADGPDVKIAFQVADYKAQTKANVGASTEFKSFKCKAFLHADGYESITQDFFGADGETIVPDALPNPTQWAPSHDYYWPKSNQSYINFVAWYDKNGAPTTATETALEWSSRVVAPGDTILFANEAWRYNKNNDPATYGIEASKGVPMLFHHALAQLSLKAKGVDLNDGATNYWRVVLDTVKISGVYNTGTLALTNSDPSSTQEKAWSNADGKVWSSPSNAVETALIERESDLSVVDSLTVNPTVLLAGHNVLPQALVDGQQQVTVVFSIYRKNANGYYSKERIKHVFDLNDFTASTPVTAWEMNKKITYTIIINPKTEKVLLDPVVEEWEEVDGGEYQIGTGTDGERLNG